VPALPRSGKLREVPLARQAGTEARPTKIHRAASGEGCVTRTYNLGDLFDLVAAAIPDRIAVVAGEERVTFRALAERSDRVAAAFRRLGVARGMTVGLMMYTGLEYLESFLALCKIGALPFNLNYRYTPQELLYLLRNAEAATLIHGSAFAASIGQVSGELPGLRRIVACDPGEPPPDDAVTYATLRDEPLGSTDITSGRTDDDGLLIYTGGTTGLPKGVHWTHRAFFYGALGGGGIAHPEGPVTGPEQLAERAAQFQPGANLTLLPMMHGAGLFGILATLFAGQRLVLYTARSFDAEHAWDLAHREKVNAMSFVGDAMVSPLVDAWDSNPGRWSMDSLRMFSWGGASLSGRLQEALDQRFPGVVRTTGLGSSESGSFGMSAPGKGGEDGLLKLRPSDNVAVIVDGNRFAAPGETGILARTGALPEGYWRDPEKTVATFPTIDGRRWVLTGDRARVEPDGTMTLFGRDSTCISTGGEKVFAEEVEAVICGHAAVRDALVVGEPDERWGQVVVAVAALRPGMTLSLEELREHCAGTLARYKHPKRLVIAPEIKRSPAGKADYSWARTVAAST
jgi:fatty-acyl-CoA synthase